uniref:Periviscerokinin-2 n=1 Tax=Musca domestica TaxID=7370 RepID=PVK2_MUSDO|nr:RecName: Full=Periviscerokinin-2; AltName: Full=Musdo-PVK-2 [Musca domestica]
ASLFNAPRV